MSRVLDFARNEPDFRPSRQLAFELRPLLALALSTAGLCQGMPPARSPSGTAPGDRQLPVLSPPTPCAPPHRRHGLATVGDLRGGDPELLFTALSSLVEVVKSLTPGAGRMYAHLGHEAVPRHEREAGAARSEVVIELVSIASSAANSPPAATPAASGALAFELAVVAAIVESKGGQLALGLPGGPSRSFVVRLPVRRS